MPRVFFVSYAYPPVGGVGVQRVLKWTKFLPEFGWDCTVLTAANPSVPILDQELLRQVPEATHVIRGRTLEPGYATKQAMPKNPGLASRAKAVLKRPLVGAARRLLQPDAQILWNRDAYRVGRQTLASLRHDVIVATAPPFSSLLLGRKLAIAAKLPYVIDYRDEWDLSNNHWENKRPGPIATAVQRRMQNAAMKQADLILSTSPGSAAQLAKRASQAGLTRTSEHIYNGYDPDDFPPLPEQPREDFGNGTDRYRLTFAGTLWALNSIEAFARGVESLPPEEARQLELVCVGRRLEDEERFLDQIEAAGVAVVRMGFVSHQRAIELIQRSDGLLQQTLVADGTDRVISAKTFEYIAAGRPTLLVGRDGDQADVVRSVVGNRVADPADPQAIAAALIDMMTNRNAEPGERPTQYLRREQAKELAGKLDRLIAGR